MKFIIFEIPGMVSRNRNTLNNMYLTLLDALIEKISSWPDFNYLIEKLQKFRSKLIEKCLCAFDATDDQFNTLIHGDLWNNNIMIKSTKTNESENVLLIDLQMCCWTSPAIDLHYFFNTSLNEDLRLNHQNELLRFYHQQLTNILQQLNYQKTIFKFDELLAQFMTKIVYGNHFLTMFGLPSIKFT